MKVGEDNTTMVDTTFAVTGKKLTHGGNIYTITSAGINNDQPTQRLSRMMPQLCKPL
jgi:hypothetical protein